MTVQLSICWQRGNYGSVSGHICLALADANRICPAAELYWRMKSEKLAERHLALSRETVVKLANSLSAGKPLRQTFLSAPMIRKILGDAETSKSYAIEA
jgi:hypothetical protein